MSLLTVPVVKTVIFQLEFYLRLNMYSKEHPKTNLKIFHYQILTSVKKLEKQLPSKENLAHFCNLISPSLG